MRINCLISSALWLPLLVLEALSGAPRPKLIREINLNELIRESGDWRASSHAVEEIVFSPDEGWVAVGVGPHWKEGPIDPRVGVQYMSHVLVVPLKNSQGRSLQFDVPYLLGGGGLHWSPGSNVLAVGDSMYAIPSGELWKYDPVGSGGGLLGFVSLDQEIRLKPLPPGFFDIDPVGAAQQFVKMPIVFQTLNLTGRVLDEWTKPQNWTVYGVNPDRHLVIFETAMPKESCGRQYCSTTLVMDYMAKEVIQEWQWPSGPIGKPYFAEGGKTLCSAELNGRDSRRAQCFDIDSGKKITEFTGFKGGDPADVTTHASRIALSHIDLIQGINEEFDRDSYQDRVIWDFRANTEVAEWAPTTQINESYYNGGVKKVTAWGPFAISATGHYLAEGSNGILRIYELP